MAGVYDTVLKNAAQQAVKLLGEGLDISITYSANTKGSYNVATGEQIVSKTTYADIKVPMTLVSSVSEDKGETRQATLYVSPDLINNHQPTLGDEITLSFAGGTHVSQVVDIKTYKGSQTYLFVLRVLF